MAAFIRSTHLSVVLSCYTDNAAHCLLFLPLLTRAAFHGLKEAVWCANIQKWSLTKHQAVYPQPCLNSRLNSVPRRTFFDILVRPQSCPVRNREGIE